MTTTISKNKKSRRRFKAEVNQLLNILINSVYSHKEIFLRELISNSSDALDKLRILSLTDKSIIQENEELTVFLEIDKGNQTLSISDNGIGMHYEEVVENIGTIAQSGSKKFKEFLEKTSDQKLDSELIGQFGVGFYSAFMVADKVTLLTRHAQSDKGIKWESIGDGSYTIEECDKPERGTQIILHLKGLAEENKEADEDFLAQYTIQKHVQKHCNFINYPIRMNFVTEESEKDKDGKVIEGKTNTVITEKTLNTIQPIWEKDKKALKKEDYQEFYKKHFHDWNEPAEILHFRGEGTIEFSALLFIPSKAPHDLYTGGAQKGIQLYNRHVLIFESCEDLLPEHFRFVRGIVDTPDLSLNISRELLQHDQQLRAIRNFLEKKIIEALKSILKKDRKKYEELWGELGQAVKGGIFAEYKNADKLQDLLLFETSHTTEGKTTLKEYVERMPETQEEIFYVPGADRATIERLPQMEVIKDEKVEVLYFLDRVDEFLTQNLSEYETKKLRSILKGELDFKKDKDKDDSEKSPDDPEKKDDDKTSDDEYKALLEAMKKGLEGKVKDVRLSKRLKTSAVCLVSDSTGYSMNMERLYREANHTMYRAQRILEINPSHETIKTLHKLCGENKDESKISTYANLLYNSALLIENEKIEDPVDVANSVSRLIVEAHQ